LLSAKDCFNLAFALSLMSYAGRSSSSEDGQNGHQSEERDECITSFAAHL
jgi:hypothetical protein